MRFLFRSMVGVFLTAAALALLVWAGVLVRGAVQERLTADNTAPPARERVFSVNVVTAVADTHVPVLESFGEISSRRTLELRAPTGGRVVFLAHSFEDGGAVAEGEILLRLDPADAQAAVERAQNDLADALAEKRDAARGLELAGDELRAAEEQAELRTRALQRQTDLAERGVATMAATETAELAVSAAQQTVLARRQAIAQAEARVDLAATREARIRLALAEAERRLDDMVITAPFNGTLSAKNVVEGRLVTSNERLADLIDADDLEVSFRVSTAQYARLLDASGDLILADVTVTLDASGVDLAARGRITRASGSAGQGQTGRLIFAALGRAAGFKPGDFVTVRVAEPPLENTVQLPASAINAQGEVLVIGADDRLEAVGVSVLRRQGDDVLVRGPILGRDVVEARSPLLGAGIAVKPLRQGVVGQASVVPDMVELTEEHRARLVALVENNSRMPEDAKARVLVQLSQPSVPAAMVARIESRLGG